MISPNMATMLCFVTCDAALLSEAWHDLLRGAVAASFNRVTVDGEESTNDMVLGLCNGASGVTPGEEGLSRLDEVLRQALLSLAVSIVADGEGSTHTMRLMVTGAPDESAAKGVARAVADSPLVKTSFFGRDANWGRIVQAVGQGLEGHAGEASVLRIAYEDVVVVADGDPVDLGEAARERLAAVMRQPEIDLQVDLGDQGVETTVYFSDLTHDYVTLNAEYST